MLLAAACTNSVSQSESSNSNQGEEPISTAAITSTTVPEDPTSKISSEDSISPTNSIPDISQKESKDLPTDIPPTQLVNESPTMPPVPSSSVVAKDAVLYVIDQSKSYVNYGVGETLLNQNNRYN